MVDLRRAGLVAVMALALSACGGSPVTPSAPALTGTWSGTFSDSGMTPARMTWLITQNGNQISGSFSATDLVSGILTVNATTQGTLNGSNLQSTWTIPLGGAILVPNCSATMNAQSTVSNNTMIGTYTGTNSCTGPVTNGQFNLTK